MNLLARLVNRTLRRVDAHVQGSVYLSVLGRVVNVASALSLNNHWQRWVKRSLSLERSPMWAAEMFQMAVLAVAALLISFRLPIASVSSYTAAFFAAYRLIDIAVFALAWLLVHRGAVKDFRRSFVTFLLNLAEVALLATLLLGPFRSVTVGWAETYPLFGSVFTMSLPDMQAWPLRAVVVMHAVLAEAWLLLLTVLAVVLGGITRDDISAQNGAT
jgi:hypothetical protein